MPPKIRDLIAELKRAGFVDRGGKGSHRNFVHPKVVEPITISGGLGEDAPHYQIRAVRLAIEEAKK
ncbi:MAG: type II toxin-antitoxin system HicA family toxin [Gammaproteobacteria bacterium]|nr:type II toxin-antitoxin system HicA family toxin [Gammaproteobacteria bacterium]